jgi:drug/metabolite transporter (DMT)-like permease
MGALASICGTVGAGPVAMMLATGAMLTVAMMAPCALVEAGKVRERRVAFALGYAAVMLAVGAAGAGLELMLAPVLDAPMLRIMLGLAAAVLLACNCAIARRLSPVDSAPVSATRSTSSRYVLR